MSPTAGRFLTRDPIGFEGSEWGLYEFLNSQPVDNVDPTGEISSSDFASGMLGFLDQFSPRVGVRQCYRVCTQIISPPIGCVCITGCVETDVRQCCMPDAKCCGTGVRKICNVTRIEVNVGLFVCTSLGGRGFAVPPFPAFQTAAMPAVKRPGSVVGGVSSSSCPKEGNSGSVCITASAGFSTWTYGARACYDFGSGRTTIDTGLGVGTGTGISGGGAWTLTSCISTGSCCN